MLNVFKLHKITPVQFYELNLLVVDVMNVLAFYEKVTNKCFNYEVGTNAPKIFKVNLDLENVYKFFKSECSLIIVLKDGKDMIVDCFFNESENNQLILETGSEEYLLVSLSGISLETSVSEIESVNIKNLKDITENESTHKNAILKWLARSKVGIGGSQRLSVFNLVNSF